MNVVLHYHVLNRMGKSFLGHHQLCLAHDAQLAVIDVLYKKTEDYAPIIALIAGTTSKDDSSCDEGDNSEDDDNSNGALVVELLRVITSPKRICIPRYHRKGAKTFKVLQKIAYEKRFITKLRYQRA